MNEGIVFFHRSNFFLINLCNAVKHNASVDNEDKSGSNVDDKACPGMSQTGEDDEGGSDARSSFLIT